MTCWKPSEGEADGNKDIVVVGAGIAGLTAAFRLQQAGHNVRVLEASDHVGGRMITIAWHGIRIDPGAEFVTSGDRYLLALVDQLGVADKLRDYSEEATGFDVSVMRDGAVHRVNFMSLPSYFRWRGVSLGARLRMAKLLPYLLRYARADPLHPERAPGADARSMEQFFYERVSGEMFEYLIEPMMDVFCSYMAADLSEDMMLLLFGSYLGRKLYTFEGGVGFLPEALAGRLDVVYNAPVSRIAHGADGGASVHYQANGQAEALDADVVVVAVPGDVALGLCDTPRLAWERFFPCVGYTRVGVVFHLVEGDDPALDKGGIMFPRKEPWQLCALGWERKPDGRVLVMSDLKAHRYDAAMPDADLKAIITEEMIRVVPAFAGAIRDQMVFRWPRKVPRFPAGYRNALRDFKANPQEGPVYFCGDYFIGPSAGSALVSGWQCADRLLGVS
ncbi:MAG: FAD-dependent oxidoreductase [Anaerolineae bacterium]|nr:FAD-dependent oxidoreductase [Anaerolineae bacterium]